MFSRSVSNQCNEKSLPLNNIPIGQKQQPPASSVFSDVDKDTGTRYGVGEDLRRRILSLSPDLKGWNGMFIRQLQSRARISKRDEKPFKLSQWQLGQLEKVEAIVEGVAR